MHWNLPVYCIHATNIFTWSKIKIDGSLKCGEYTEAFAQVASMLNCFACAVFSEIPLTGTRRTVTAFNSNVHMPCILLARACTTTTSKCLVRVSRSACQECHPSFPGWIGLHVWRYLSARPVCRRGLPIPSHDLARVTSTVTYRICVQVLLNIWVICLRYFECVYMCCGRSLVQVKVIHVYVICSCALGWSAWGLLCYEIAQKS